PKSLSPLNLWVFPLLTAAFPRTLGLTLGTHLFWHKCARQAPVPEKLRPFVHTCTLVSTIPPSCLVNLLGQLIAHINPVAFDPASDPRIALARGVTDGADRFG